MECFSMDVHIVDDEESIRTLYADMFETLNYRAQLFSSATDYLEYMTSADYLPPKLAILSDVNMPAMSGYELMAAVRESYPHKRFIISTGSPEVPTQKESSCFYLTKPIRFAKLKSVLRGLSLCNEGGALPGIIGCESIGDRCDFCVAAWECPRNAS